jgi:hypothetical protein
MQTQKESIDKLQREVLNRIGPIYFPGAEFPIPYPHPSAAQIRRVFNTVLGTLRSEVLDPADLNQGATGVTG